MYTSFIYIYMYISFGKLEGLLRMTRKPSQETISLLSAEGKEWPCRIIYICIVLYWYPCIIGILFLMSVYSQLKAKEWLCSIVYIYSIILVSLYHIAMLVLYWYPLLDVCQNSFIIRKTVILKQIKIG